MPTRMINPAHGAMDVYSTNDVDAAIKNGWHVETDADRAAFAAEIARKSGAGEPPAEEVAGDITRGGVRERGTILWSHLADPGTIPTSWDIADATKDAGDQSLSETNGTLIDSLPLGDMNIIYKDDAAPQRAKRGPKPKAK